ncbi:5-formyltetrahydrofolate cyclo-ligase [Saccharibacter sp. 17.LH.SD]|uniref:5-formyltetrahydrofolate cyclo-ligase n=1 Tax=Saccharibacter sp. 17.LH.SD TaxID=2689393 RepID=UPI00136D9A29|nr:5-formyltetrahydrofolate cyclo-ligase [Saccharibacter sp. 17.LH.SD]MXV43667.1 5-formyltetrahydrofolate cyclo-ligase [Saccharibacter sp. 17.LH.SD]
MSSLSLDHQKKELRRLLRAQRAAPLPRHNRQIIQKIFYLLRRLGARRVAAVWPLPGEIDLRPLCFQADRAGYRVLLPEAPPIGQPLHFRFWRPSSPLRQGRFGTSYPAGPREEPDVILVPMLAFDRHGGRIGYGGGYYDRTLDLWSHKPSIGYALAQQEQPLVPMDRFDQRLTYIVTEREIIHPESVDVNYRM